MVEPPHVRTMGIQGLNYLHIWHSSLYFYSCHGESSVNSATFHPAATHSVILGAMTLCGDPTGSTLFILGRVAHHDAALTNTGSSGALL